MKTLTIKLPDELANEIEAESRRRKVSKSEVARERLSRKPDPAENQAQLDDLSDLIGSVDGLPEDLSERRKAWLEKTGYGRSGAR